MVNYVDCFVSLVILSLDGHLADFAFVFEFEVLGGTEHGDVVFGDDDGNVLGDVACGFLCALFDYEAAEAAEVNVLFAYHGFFDDLHEGINGCDDDLLVYACTLGNL